MSTVKTIFDGKTIHVPPEMIDAEPGEVMITYDPRKKPGKSIWDLIGKYKGNRTAEDIDAQIREERDDWGDR